MPRKPSPERQAELDRLCAICGVLIDVKAELWMPDDMVWTAREAVEKAHANGWTSGLRQAVTDSVEMTQDLSGAQLRAIDSMLRERAGVSLDELQTRRLARIRRVLNRGRVRNDEEGRLLNARADEIHVDPDRQDELRRINDLLAEYESRRGRGPSAEPGPDAPAS